MYGIAWYFIVLHCIALYRMVSYFIQLHCTLLHAIALLAIDINQENCLNMSHT